MKNNILIIFFVIFCGCATSFQNHVNVSLNQSANASTEIFSIVESIAATHGLKKDSSNSIAGKKISFFGKPYHYYIFEVEDTKDEKITLKFTHEARMSSRSKGRDEPEKEFLEIIKKTFSSDIEKLDYNFRE